MITRCDAQSGDVIVYHGPQRRLPVVRGRKGAVDGEGGSDGQHEETDPVDVVEDVSERDGWSVFLGGEGVGDVVVGDVEVGWGVGRFDRRGWKGWDFIEALNGHLCLLRRHRRTERRVRLVRRRRTHPLCGSDELWWRRVGHGVWCLRRWKRVCVWVGVHKMLLE